MPRKKYTKNKLLE